MSTANKSSLLSQLQESASAFWGERNARERMILTLGGVALLLALVYMILFAPALKGRAQLNKDLPDQRVRLAQMHVLATQASDLQTAAAIQVEPVSQDAIGASLTAHGLKPKSVSVSDGLVRLQLDPVSFAGLLDWLADQQKTAHLTVLEANFIGTPQLDMVNATLTLRQQHNEG